MNTDPRIANPSGVPRRLVRGAAILEVLAVLVGGSLLARAVSDSVGAAGGIVITAFVFAFSHTQYFRLSVMSIGTLTGIVFSSILAGYFRPTDVGCGSSSPASSRYPRRWRSHCSCSSSSLCCSRSLWQWHWWSRREYWRW